MIIDLEWSVRSWVFVARGLLGFAVVPAERRQDRVPELERIPAELGSRFEKPPVYLISLYRPLDHTIIGPSSIGSPRSPIRSKSGMPRAPITSAEPADPPSQFSSMAPTSAQFPDIRAAISKLRWDARCTRMATASVRGRTERGHRQARCDSCRDASARMVAWPRRHCFQRRRRRAAASCSVRHSSP